MKDFFDRKTFDPINKEADLKTLNQLRSFGGSRGNESTAMVWAMSTLNWELGFPEKPKSGCFIDIGCGDSRDWLHAKETGFIANRLDLFPPRIDLPEQKWVDFIKADAVERIPFPNEIADIIICQAMLDLVEPVAREQFFREVDRVLKVGGIFSCYIQWLQSGWGFDLQEEQERASKVWGLIHPKAGGFLVIKGEKQ